MPESASNVESILFFLVLFYTRWLIICNGFKLSSTNSSFKPGLSRTVPSLFVEDGTCHESLTSCSLPGFKSSWSSIYSRTSIETVIHTGDCEDYDVNCVQYRKARYWRELSTADLEEEIRKVRKVLAKINMYRATKNPALHPSSLGNTRRTLAQLLFIRHERHLASLREKEELKKTRSILQSSSGAGDVNDLSASLDV